MGYKRDNRLWDAAKHDAVLKRMHGEGKTDTEIAIAVRFSSDTVREHRIALGLPPVDRAKKQSKESGRNKLTECGQGAQMLLCLTQDS